LHLPLQIWGEVDRPGNAFSARAPLALALPSLVPQYFHADEALI
jgi:hypothetical protein